MQPAPPDPRPPDVIVSTCKEHGHHTKYAVTAAHVLSALARGPASVCATGTMPDSLPLILLPASLSLQGRNLPRLRVLVDPGSQVPGILNGRLASALRAGRSRDTVELASGLGEGGVSAHCPYTKEPLRLALGHNREFETDLKFLVDETLHYDAILGLPFLAFFNGTVDCAGRAVRLGTVLLEAGPAPPPASHHPQPPATAPPNASPPASIPRPWQHNLIKQMIMSANGIATPAQPHASPTAAATPHLRSPAATHAHVLAAI